MNQRSSKPSLLAFDLCGIQSVVQCEEKERRQGSNPLQADWDNHSALLLWRQTGRAHFAERAPTRRGLGERFALSLCSFLSFSHFSWFPAGKPIQNVSTRAVRGSRARRRFASRACLVSRRMCMKLEHRGVHMRMLPLVSTPSLTCDGVARSAHDRVADPCARVKGARFALALAMGAKGDPCQSRGQSFQRTFASRRRRQSWRSRLLLLLVLLAALADPLCGSTGDGYPAEADMSMSIWLAILRESCCWGPCATTACMCLRERTSWCKAIPQCVAEQQSRARLKTKVVVLPRIARAFPSSSSCCGWMRTFFKLGFIYRCCCFLVCICGPEAASLSVCTCGCEIATTCELRMLHACRRVARSSSSSGANSGFCSPATTIQPAVHGSACACWLETCSKGSHTQSERKLV